jgi:import inner membrane translocase subunit TIM16
MSYDEALKILNIEKNVVDEKVLGESFKKFYELNDPAKGGSFYIQSKIYRANEAISKELGLDSANADNKEEAAGNKEEKGGERGDQKNEESGQQADDGQKKT